MKARAVKILLAEDDHVARLVTQTMLERKNHVVSCVYSGLEACKRLESEKFDIVLMDISMPGMDGITATRHIRESNHSNRRIPVIAITAHNLDDVRPQCLDAGMNDFLVKPVSGEILLQTIKRWTPQQTEI